MRSRTSAAMPARSTIAFITLHISVCLSWSASRMASRCAALSSSDTPAAFIDSR